MRFRIDVLLLEVGSAQKQAIHLSKCRKNLKTIRAFLDFYIQFLVLRRKRAGFTGILRGLRGWYKQKRLSIVLSLFSVPYDILFSNEFLKDLSRLWSLRDILPDPNNMPWIEKIDK